MSDDRELIEDVLLDEELLLLLDNDEDDELEDDELELELDDDELLELEELDSSTKQSTLRIV